MSRGRPARPGHPVSKVRAVPLAEPAPRVRPGPLGKTIVVEKEKPIIVEKIVEVPAQAKPTQILRFWTVWWGWHGPGANGERSKPWKELVDMWNEQRHQRPRGTGGEPAHY